MNEHVPRVVIVGGGFGGLAAAKALRWAPVEVILIDRTNHHLFQPLLYQVATSVLAPGQISAPIRGILAKQRNTTVILGEVSDVNKEQRYVVASSTDRSESRRGSVLSIVNSRSSLAFASKASELAVTTAGRLTVEC